MQSIENQSQFGDLTGNKENQFVASILQNPYLGLCVVVGLALIYLFNITAELCTKRKRNDVIIPRSKASDNLQAKKKRSLDHEIEESYRKQLMNQLQLEYKQKKQEQKTSSTTMRGQLTMYESYALARGVKMSTKIQMNNAKKQEQKKKKQQEKMKQEKLKQAQQARIAHKARKISQKPLQTNESFVSTEPATRIKVTPLEEKLSKQTKTKTKQISEATTTIDKLKETPSFGNSTLNTANPIFAPPREQPKIDDKQQEKSATNIPFTGFGPVSAQINLNTANQKPVPIIFKASAPTDSIKPTQNIEKINKPQTDKNLQFPPSIARDSAPSIPPNFSGPSVASSSPASAVPSIRPVPQSRPANKLSAFEFLQFYQKFVDNMGEVVPIDSKIEDLLGARSLPSEILTEAKTQINSIDKSNDKQLNAFAQALYHNIVFQFINKSNVKSNLERIPPKSRTDQCEKNSINKYALTVNIYRLMGPCKRVWMIVFGKLLKLLDFLYKRKTDLQSYHKLQLIQNGYIKKYKEVHSKYLSRLDFLIYMLFALTSFDPILIFRQVQEKERDAEKTRLQIESWGNTWSYSQFWALCAVIFANKHQSYSKPVVYINLLYTLYPRIFQSKKNPSLFREENDLFIITLQKSKKYLQGFKLLNQVKILSQCDENQQSNYEYDGYDFVKSIKVLDNRIPEKGTEFKLNAKEFESKANIFYYFTKEK